MNGLGSGVFSRMSVPTIKASEPRGFYLRTDFMTIAMDFYLIDPRTGL